MVGRIKVFATAAGGVLPARTKGVLAGLAVGHKLVDRIEVFATAADPAQTTGVAAELAVGQKLVDRIEVFATAAGGVMLPP